VQNSVSKRTALIVVSTGSFLTPFMGSSVNIALPSISRDLMMDAILLSWIATAYSLSSAIFLVPFGRAADIHGRRRVFLVGMAIYGVFSLLCGLASSGTMLVAFRVLQGIGGAMLFGTGVAILTSVFPPQERGQALGINVAAVYMGLSLGPVLGGLLTYNLGWRSVFLINVPLAAVVIAITLAYLRGEWAECKGEPFDWRGAAIYGAGLASLMYGFSRLPGALGAALVVMGIAGIAAFAAWESRVRFPVLDVNLFRRSKVFALANLAALINYATTFAVTFVLSLYLQVVQGLTPRDAGLILVAQPLVMTVVASRSGRWSDRLDPRWLASAGMAVTLVGLLLLTTLREDTPTGFLLVTLGVLGLGFGLFSSPNTNSIMGSVEKRHLGLASGTVGTMRLTGQMLSMGIATLVLQAFVGDVPVGTAPRAEFIQAADTIFLVFAALSGLGIWASWSRGRRRD